MAEVGQAWQNGYAERLMRTIKKEEVQLQDYEDYHDAYTQIGKFLGEVYQRKRIHSSLGYLTPTEFEAQWLKRGSSSESKPKPRIPTFKPDFRVQDQGRSTAVNHRVSIRSLVRLQVLVPKPPILRQLPRNKDCESALGCPAPIIGRLYYLVEPPTISKGRV